MPDAVIIYNPNAGKFANEVISHQAASILREMGWEIEIQKSENAEHVTELARQAADAKSGAVILSGGDGSIGKAINGLIHSDTALGVLPFGTTNVWAQEIGLPKFAPQNQQASLTKICAALVESKSVAVDAGVCNNIYFLLWAGLGLDAMVIQESEQKRAHWKKKVVELEYGYRTIKNIFSWTGMACTLTIDDNPATVHGDYIIGLISNVRLYAGGRVTISPAARLDDGEMDLWLFPGDNWRASLQHVWRVMTGKHELDDSVRRIPFRNLTIETQTPAPLHTDGEPAATTNKVEISVEHKALNVLIPPSAPTHLLPHE